MARLQVYLYDLCNFKKYSEAANRLNGMTNLAYPSQKKSKSLREKYDLRLPSNED